MGGALVFAVSATIASLYVLPNIFPAHIGNGYIGAHCILTALMLLGWARGNISVQAILLAGIAARILLFPLPIFTSNDAERYLWDGAVALAGFDPYITAPADSVVSSLRSLWATPPEHAAYATIYPPGALMLFAASALAGPVWGVWIWKGLASAASIASLLLMHRILTRRNLSHHLPLFALSPLLILETGAGAHLDVFLVFSIVAAFALLDEKRVGFAGAMLGVGAAIKFLPAVLLAPLALSLSRSQAIRLCVAGGAVVMAFYGAALAVGYQPIGVLGVFFEKWRFGSPLYSLLTNTFDLQTARILLGLIGVILVLVAVRFAFRRDYIFSSMIFLAIPFLLSPVVFPWYLSVLVPLFAIRPNATVLVWVTVAPFSYEVLNKWLSVGEWVPAAWPIWLIGVGLLAGLVVDLGRYGRGNTLSFGALK